MAESNTVNLLWNDIPGVTVRLTIDTIDPLPWQIWAELGKVAETIENFYADLEIRKAEHA